MAELLQIHIVQCVNFAPEESDMQTILHSSHNLESVLHDFSKMATTSVSEAKIENKSNAMKTASKKCSFI